VPSFAEVVERFAEHDVVHVGVTDATPLFEARASLLERRAQGLHDGMGFTYRNPDRSTTPVRAVPGARSIIVAARSYLAADEDAPPTHAAPARVARYAWIDHYAPLRAALRDVAQMIRRSGERAVAFADDNSIVDRAVAHRAGLGWFGKNANLLLPGAGSWFVLGSVVTTAPFEPNDRLVDDGCGSCRRCIDRCPTGAIVAPGVVDAARCISWILQKPGTIPVHNRAAIGDRIYGCDDCQDACPVSVRLGPRHRVDPTDPGPRGAWIDALWLLEADDASLFQAIGHWYVADRDPRWIRRNALVVVGNTARADDPAVGAVLQRYATGDDEVLADHAVWARDRLAGVAA
jgi:epoxyqueuosine reductase